MPEYVIPRGKVVSPKFKYTRRCTHVHVSGRRCEVRAPKKDAHGSAVLFCLLHNGPVECKECRSMMSAFKPKKGWD